SDGAIASQSRRRKPSRGRRRISAYSPGWEVFRVTDAIQDWLRNQTANHGLLLTLRSLIGDKLDPSALRVMKRKHANGRQPILVVFTSRPNATKAPANISNIESETTTDNSSRTRRSSDKNQIAECSRHNLYVDFETIGWSGWIISPKGYNAHYCAGQCSYPLGQNQRPTNHATVQSIVHEMRLHSGGVTAPCCVPNKLLAISLLFFDENENVILKQYDGMVAAVCGCH
uniref:TGF-beta family profile domain-containing protein n=1 Tax=Strigamia maritima TaxID=126957 RepID=T1INV8_STRMM